MQSTYFLQAAGEFLAIGDIFLQTSGLIKIYGNRKHFIFLFSLKKGPKKGKQHIKHDNTA